MTSTVLAEGTTMVKRPSISVTDPVVVPLIRILTPGKVSPLSEELTVPLTSKVVF